MTEIKNAEKFSYEMLVREGHLDTFGHMNNATYLQILEEARWEIITQRGYGLQEIQQKGIGPVILEIHIKYLRELKLREKIVIETQCIAVEKRKITRLLHEIKNSAGDVCCTAEIIVALFDTRTRRMISLPPDWLNALGIEIEEQKNA